MTIQAKNDKILDCGHAPSEHYSFTTGYGFEPGTSRKICYACCTENDKAQMRKDGKTTLYLTKRETETDYPSATHFASNWPGSLKLPIYGVRVGYHNIARRRYDVWFTFEGQNWHGTQYGDNTQILHCKKVK
jgi:hypothetical protein